MSRCVECLEPMSDFDATRYMECKDCRKNKCLYSKVRTAYGGRSEEVGRKSRASVVTGGAPIHHGSEDELEVRQ